MNHTSVLYWAIDASLFRSHLLTFNKKLTAEVMVVQVLTVAWGQKNVAFSLINEIKLLTKSWRRTARKSLQLVKIVYNPLKMAI